MYQYLNPIRHITMCAFAVTLLAGCATTPEDGEKWLDAQRLVIKTRVESRWEALIRRDFEQVYGYLSPDYRSVVSPQQYRGKFGSGVDWREANVKGIRYDSNIAASIEVEIAYRAHLPGVRSEQFENIKLNVEKWIYKDGNWWYTDQ